MDYGKNKLAFALLVALASIGCSSTSTTFAEALPDGGAGTAGAGAGETGGTDAGGGGVDAGGQGGIAGTGAGGIGGSSTGGAGGTGGLGGSSTGGAGGIGTGGAGGAGGAETGGQGGTGGIGGQGGTGGGGPCVEYGYNEIVQLCQGNCGTIPHKCDSGTFNCLQFDGSNTCTLSHQWCELQPDGSGTCGGCVRNTNPGKDICGMGFAKPFEYVCPAEFANSIQDQGETDVDCGGPVNPGKCLAGQSCAGNDDCQKQACVSGTCANSSFAEIGCDWHYIQGVWCCPESQNGCVRMPQQDAAFCGGTPGTPYFMQCNLGQNLSIYGCVQTNGNWCCPGEFL